MSNGLQEFYDSYSTFLVELGEGVLSHENESQYDDDIDELDALTMSNMRGAMTLFLCFTAINCFIFLIEVIVAKWKERRILRNFVYHPWEGEWKWLNNSLFD